MDPEAAPIPLTLCHSHRRPGPDHTRRFTLGIKHPHGLDSVRGEVTILKSEVETWPSSLPMQLPSHAYRYRYEGSMAISPIFPRPPLLAVPPAGHTPDVTLPPLPAAYSPACGLSTAGARAPSPAPWRMCTCGRMCPAGSARRTARTARPWRPPAPHSTRMQLPT